MKIILNKKIYPMYMSYYSIDYDEMNVTSKSENYNSRSSGILFFVIFIIAIYTFSNFCVVIIIVSKKCSMNKIQDINFDNYFLKNPIPPEKELICSICMDNFDNNYVLTKCNHYYHKDCIYEWLKLKVICPNCKSNFEQLEN